MYDFIREQEKEKNKARKNIGADIGNGIGPMLGGAISSMFNYKIMFISVSVFMGLTAIFFNIYQKNKAYPAPIGKQL